MKKKILFGLGTLALIAMLLVNVSLVQGNQKLSLQVSRASATVIKNNKQLYSNGTLFCCKSATDYDCQSANCN